MSTKPLSKLNDAFYKKLVEISGRLNIKPDDLLLIMFVESGLNPTEVNKINASGLTQMMPKTLRYLGFTGTAGEFSQLDAEKQLDYVEKYFSRNLKNVTNATQAYIANLLPVALGWRGVINQVDDTILAEKDNYATYAKDPNVFRSSSVSENNRGGLTLDKVYEANKGLDFNKDGKITYGDIKNFMERKRKNPTYQDALAKMNEAVSKSTTEAATGETENTFMNYISQIVDQLKTMIGQASSNNNYLIKNALFDYLPSQNILVKITSPRLEDNLELARILATAYEDLIIADCSTYTDNKSVELLCKTTGTLKSCYGAVAELTGAVSKEFNKIVGSKDIKIKIIANKKPSYKHVSIKAAEYNFRKFKFKQMSKYNG